MEQNQSNALKGVTTQPTMQANTRLSHDFHLMIQQSAIANHRRFSDELRMLLEIGYQTKYGTTGRQAA